MNKDIRYCKPKGSRGFSLIEVMVTVGVISVGILGMISLQTTALQIANETSHQVTANILLQDMAGRLHANAADANLGLTSRYHVLGRTPGQPINPQCLSSNNACPSSKMAIHDLGDWQTSVSAALPNSQGIVCMETSPSTTPTMPPTCSAAPAANPNPVIFTVKVAWTERDGTPRSVLTFVQP